MACACKLKRKEAIPQWRKTYVRRANRTQSVEMYSYKPKESVICLKCGNEWRTAAKYPDKLAVITEAERQTWLFN